MTDPKPKPPVENSGEKLKTSIAVDAALWERFDLELRRRWRERSYSRGLERVIATWLDDESPLPATQNPQPHSPEIAALIAWYQSPPKGLDRALKLFLKERIDQLRETRAHAERKEEKAG